MQFDGDEIPQSDEPETVVVVGTPATGAHERYSELIDPESDGFDLIAGYVAQQTYKQLVDINERLILEIKSRLETLSNSIHDDIVDGKIPIYAFSKENFEKFSVAHSALIEGNVSFNIFDEINVRLDKGFK